MTPQRANQILFECALTCENQGRSADEFRFIVDMSPADFGPEFSEAVGVQYKIIDHVIAMVWVDTTTTQPGRMKFPNYY